MTPEATWQSPQNTTGSAQIVVAVPSAQPFLAAGIESKIPGVTWLDESYVESPAAAPSWQFISFTVKELGTKSIPFEAGVETPLFTFRSASGDCAGGLLLLENSDPLVQDVVKKNNFNITQNLTVLGMRGNAVKGIGESKIECPEKQPAISTKWISKVKASPIPASTHLDLSWVNGEGLQTLELQLFNDKGQIIKTHVLSIAPGDQAFRVKTETLAQGLYSGTFIANGKQKESFRMAVMP